MSFPLAHRASPGRGPGGLFPLFPSLFSFLDSPWETKFPLGNEVPSGWEKRGGKKAKSHEIKLVMICGSCSGGGRGEAARLLSIHAMLSPSVRMVWSPSKSRFTSSGENP